MGLACTAENYRAEIARHQIQQQDLADAIGMNRNQLSNYLTGNRPLPDWAARTIAAGLNRLLGREIFSVAEGDRHRRAGT